MKRIHPKRKHKLGMKTRSSNIAVTVSMLPCRELCERLESIFPASQLDAIGQAVRKLEAATPKYAALPPSLASLSADLLFLAARSYGRVSYRDDLYIYDETTSSMVYQPLPLSRDEVCEVVSDLVSPAAASTFIGRAVPLSWRAGFVHGWLSALQVSQPREAGIGLTAFEYYLTSLLRLSSASK